MIVLALLASSAAVGCDVLALRPGDPVAVTSTAIAGEALGGKPAVQPGSSPPNFVVGELLYHGEGIQYRSADPRFADIAVANSGFTHPCGYGLGPVTANGSTSLKFHQTTITMPPGATAAAQQGSTPVLAGFTPASTWPIYANGGKFFVGLMHPDKQAQGTVVVAFSGKAGPSPARIIARLPMRFDRISALPGLHSPTYHLSLTGREADGALNSLGFELTPLEKDALTREFGDPPSPSLNLCPVGGEPYGVFIPGTYSTFGQRPDGKPYSYMRFPLPIPECPTNKLVVFDNFSEAEVGRLSQLIATPEYRRLVASEPAHYRGFWLASRLGRPGSQALWLLLEAIWQVTPDATSRDTGDSKARRARYQAEFVEGVKKLPSTMSPQDRLPLEARGANAARQMGRFDEAGQMLSKALATLQQATSKNGWDTYLAQLGAVIARRDDSAEPLDMIPANEVAAACGTRTTMRDFDKAICSKQK